MHKRLVTGSKSSGASLVIFRRSFPESHLAERAGSGEGCVDPAKRQAEQLPCRESSPRLQQSPARDEGRSRTKRYVCYEETEYLEEANDHTSLRSMQER